MLSTNALKKNNNNVSHPGEKERKEKNYNFNGVTLGGKLERFRSDEEGLCPGGRRLVRTVVRRPPACCPEEKGAVVYS